MSNNKVLIVGAGLGGLVLAHILLKNGVPFEIFERDASTSSRSQGWAVALVECIPELKELLPEDVARDLHSNSVNYNNGVYDEIGFYDSKTGKESMKLGGVAPGEQGYLLRVSRMGFRNFLLDAHSLPVSMGKYLTHYEEKDDSVTAFFKDGTSATGSLLVGADGVHSHVLDQLVGASHHRPVLSKYVPIFGEVTLPPRLYEPLHKWANAVVLAGSGDFRIQIGMLHMADDKSSAAFFWSLMPRREEPEELSAWTQTAPKQEKYEFTLDAVKDQHPLIQEIIRFGGPEAITEAQPKFLEFVPTEPMPRGRVTVLGDAAHAMIPFRGAGANTAILDACHLGRLLTKAHQGQQDYSSVVDSYLKEMIPRGAYNVLASRAAGEAEGNEVELWAEKFEKRKETA